MPNDESIHNHSAGALARIEETGLFTIDDLDLISSVFSSFNTRNGTPWDALRKAHMILPSWFRAGLDPSSDEYLQQQKMLWKIVVGVDRDYDPHEDEQTNDPRGDPIRFPGYFRGRGAQAIQTAANHIIATGMIMLHSGLKPGSWALEYGAGFGQTSVALARMGVNVDTVDISAAFCGYIKEQAAFFGIHNLNPFKGEFGLNPRGAHKYDLIFFYESTQDRGRTGGAEGGRSDDGSDHRSRGFFIFRTPGPRGLLFHRRYCAGAGSGRRALESLRLLLPG